MLHTPSNPHARCTRKHRVQSNCPIVSIYTTTLLVGTLETVSMSAYNVDKPLSIAPKAKLDQLYYGQVSTH